MSVIGEGARESHCSALPRVVIQHGLGQGGAGTGEPEKIRFNCCVFGANSCIPSQLFKVQGFFICHMINYTGYNQK